MMCTAISGLVKQLIYLLLLSGPLMFAAFVIMAISTDHHYEAAGPEQQLLTPILFARIGPGPIGAGLGPS